MKNSKDKIIQEQLDKESKNAGFKRQAGHDEDEKIYRLIYSELENEPEYKLSPNFADKVVARLKPRGLARYLNPDHRLLLISILAMFILSAGLFWAFKLKLNLQVLSMSSQMVITIIAGIISLTLIQVADQKLLKSKIFKALK